MNNKKLDFILNQLADDYQNFLIERIIINSKNYNIDNIPLLDFIKLDADIKENYKIRNNFKKNRIVYRIFALCIMLSLMCGLILFLKYNDLGKLNYDTQIAFAFLMLGSCFYGIYFLLFNKFFIVNIKRFFENINPDKNKKENICNIVFYTWNKLMSLLIQLNTKEKFMPVSELIEEMCSSNILSQDEKNMVQKLRVLKNILSHNFDNIGINDYSNEEILQIIENNQEIIKKVSKILNLNNTETKLQKKTIVDNNVLQNI